MKEKERKNERYSVHATVRARACVCMYVCMCVRVCMNIDDFL